MEFAGTRNIGEPAKFFVTCNVPITLSCMPSPGTHREGRAGGSEDSYEVHTPPPLLRNTNNVEDWY